MKRFDARLNVAWWALRIGLGAGPIIAGLDKYFNKIVNWEMYLSPLATKVIPLSPSTFMHIVGIVEIIAGVVVLSRWTKIRSYVVMLWLLGIVTKNTLGGLLHILLVIAIVFLLIGVIRGRGF